MLIVCCIRQYGHGTIFNIDALRYKHVQYDKGHYLTIMYSPLNHRDSNNHLASVELSSYIIRCNRRVVFIQSFQNGENVT